jgi:hypothetical protein
MLMRSFVSLWGEETLIILGVPAWDQERHGCYSVKSAYKLLFNGKSEGVHNQQPSSSSDRLWKLEIPPKVRVFWWRVLHEFLPAKQILWRRHIEPVAFCEVCGDPGESIRHVLG